MRLRVFTGTRHTGHPIHAAEFSEISRAQKILDSFSDFFKNIFCRARQITFSG